MIIIKDKDLRKAAQSGHASFLDFICKSIRDCVSNNVTEDSMKMLNGYQNSLLAYSIFRDEIMEGGFVQLIQNGYGPYIFDNPFAKSMRIFGAHRFSKIIYKAKKIYDSNKKELTKECSDDEFMAMYEKYESFDALEEEYILNEKNISDTIATYVDENINCFIDKIV